MTVLNPRLLLNTEDAAKLTGLSAGWLERDRWLEDQKGPPFVKLGSRVFYKKADIEAWLASLQGELK